MFFIAQNVKHIYIAYSFLEFLIFFWLTVADILIAWSLFLTYHRNIVCVYKFQRKPIMK